MHLSKPLLGKEKGWGRMSLGERVEGEGGGYRRRNNTVIAPPVAGRRIGVHFLKRNLLNVWTIFLECCSSQIHSKLRGGVKRHRE